MRIRARDVAEYVARDHGLTFDDLTGQSRRRPVARPRQVAMYAMHHICPHMSYPAISQMLGGRDHTTVMHGVQRIADLILTDDDVAQAVRRTFLHFKAASPVGIGEREFRSLCEGYSQAMREAA